jgi:predicted glutamine amidotransferase
MCELLGLCFNKEVSMHLSFSGFRNRGSVNPDGWGVAWFQEDCLNLVKEPAPASRSTMAESLLNNINARSRIFVGHVRFSTVGKVDYVNTHPFYRRLNSNSWAFAHNGSVRGLGRSRSALYVPIGDTDSELLFCHLLDWMAQNGFADSSRPNFMSLHQKLLGLNRLGTLNALFSDGRSLFAYHDLNGHKGLYYLRRQAPFRRTKLQDQDFSLALGDMKDPSEKGYVVSTAPLTDEEWHRFRPGQLIRFSLGEISYSSNTWTEDETGPELIAILRILRQAPRRVPLRKLCHETQKPLESIISLINVLIRLGLIQQDSRDTVRWDDPEATYFTASERREEIDQVLGMGRFRLH